MHLENLHRILHQPFRRNAPNPAIRRAKRQAVRALAGQLLFAGHDNFSITFCLGEKEERLPPLLHGNGQWYRAIRRKFFDFGKDKEAALRQWTTDKDYLLAELPPPRKNGRASIKELGNVFVDRCRKRVEEGELTERSADEHEDTIRRMIGFVGGDCRVENLGPRDFAALRPKLAEPIISDEGTSYRNVERRAPLHRGRRIRAFLNWCWDAELIERPPRYGKEFRPRAGR